MPLPLDQVVDYIESRFFATSRESADLMQTEGAGTVITDPLFEPWLRRRGLAGLAFPDDDA